MFQLDKQKLFLDLTREYRATHKKSAAVFRRASRVLVKGGSHNLRLFEPFPFIDTHASGSRVKDVDGLTYIDFWQGHFANILGHNPRVVIRAMQREFQKGRGLATGFPGEFQWELARLILGQLKTDKIRFTTSGTLATMYAVMLAMALTKRQLVLKIGGGWHGSHPYLLKGISTYRQGLTEVESAGLPPGTEALVVVSKFNDRDDLEEKFRAYGERLACLILEPFIGAGGFIFSRPEYLRRARELSARYGALLIFDEVVSGFRFNPGGLQTLYGVKPDLTVLGKAIGGGMPVGAVAGREDVMALCAPDANPGERVKFDGGTFSGHPASMIAGLASLRHLIKQADKIYPRIGRLGALARKEIERVFAGQGFKVRCTGDGEALGVASSLLGVHFVGEETERIDSPEQVWNPEVSDFELREKIFKLAMIQEGFNIFHGYGSISAAHSQAEIQASLEAVERIARKWKNYRIGHKY
jgi:glutamate-1-semialdehyde 2,1-aminomutase